MYTFKFADIGEGIHEGKISKIMVKVGDVVKDGTDLFEVETDKITTEIASPVDGVITKILVQEGDIVHVGQALFEIDTQSTPSSDVPTTTAASASPSSEPTSLHAAVASQPAAVSPASEPQAKPAQAGASVVGEVQVSDTLFTAFGTNQMASAASDKLSSPTVLASPVARNLAKQHNIALATIVGTGPQGRITEQDVQKAIAAQKPAATPVVSEPAVSSKPAVSPTVVNQPVAANEIAKPDAIPAVTGYEGDVVLQMSSMRSAIAKALKRSWSNVAYTNITTAIDVTDIVNQRGKLKDYVLATEGIKLNVLPFFIKAIAKTLEKFPIFNAVNDESNQTLILRKAINIGIAVDTKDGLIVPNIKNANQLSVIEIAKAIKDIADRARDKKIKMADLTQGTFSVSNYGSVGALIATPVINYPEVAIAGLGTISIQLQKVGLQVVERQVVYFTVAADHRWVDGADIARFNNQVKTYMENITLLFL